MYTTFAKFARLYFPYFRTFTTKLCNFIKFRMLFQDVVIFLPVSNSFKISSKRLKVHKVLIKRIFLLQYRKQFFYKLFVLHSFVDDIFQSGFLV